MIVCDACKENANDTPHGGYNWTVSDPVLNALSFNHLCGCCNHAYAMTKAYRGEAAALEHLKGIRNIHA